MTIEQLILGSRQIVKQLIEAIDASQIGMKEAEQRILEVVNRLGQLMVDEVVAGIQDPVVENQVRVEGQRAVFNRMSNLRFINRFGGQTVRSRRAYKYVDKEGGWYPLDEKLGLDRCVGGYSPLLTYLQVLFGASESYERSQELLSPAVGFKVSATAIQRNTELTGARIEDDPYVVIEAEKQQASCDVMVVEVDGTTSPQIHEQQGVEGHKR